MFGVSKGIATALLLAASVMFALALASGSLFYQIYAVASVLIAGQLYASATRSR